MLANALNDETLAWHIENESVLRQRVFIVNGLMVVAFTLLLVWRTRVGGWIAEFFAGLGRLLGLGGKVAKSLHEKV